MPAYDDGSTPTLVTEKPPAVAITQYGEDVAGTLTYRNDSSPCSDRGQNIVYAVRMRAGCAGGGKGPLVQEGVSGTLATGNDQTLFQPVDFRHSEVGGESDATQTLQAKSTGGYSLNYMPGATNGYVVRRLTPTECERLQGMPDDHTRVPYRGKPAEECPDGPRYKAIGNSMAVPVMRWIGERMQEVDGITGTE